MCDKSLKRQKSCCNSNVTSLPADFAGNTSYNSPQQTAISHLCLVCNNDNTHLLASLKQNPHVIKIQYENKNELMVIVHDVNTSTIDLINAIQELGFSVCTAPTTQQCFVKPADTVIQFGEKQNCCSSKKGDISTCSTGNQSIQSVYWLRIAVMLSCFSICWEIIEGTTSVYFGSKEGSVSLWEFGADSLIEMLSATLIVYRFYSQIFNKSEPSDNNRKERVVTFLVGLLLGLLALATMAVSIHGLVIKSAPSSTIPGIIISAISFCVMFGLYISKTVTGVQLNSSAVLSDAICTYCCMQLSTCVFISSVAFYFDRSLWWLDSAFALGISILITRESYGILEAVYTGQDSCCASPTSESWLIRLIKQYRPVDAPAVSCGNNSINLNADCSSAGNEPPKPRCD